MMKLNISQFLIIFLISCGPDYPNFDEQNAFNYLVTQCDFGPRNPGSIGYYNCMKYMVKEL